MAQSPDTIEAKKPVAAQNPAAAGIASSGYGEADYAKASRLTLWLIGAGFFMMFAASLLMWFRFGPTMFVDLATAVANCF
ncbi:MAG: hypothetical protein AB7F96_08880 [Beijerinckiaceae bacterium]